LVKAKWDENGNIDRGNFSVLQVIFCTKKQEKSSAENVLIRALICGPKSPVWVAGQVPALVEFKGKTGKRKTGMRKKEKTKEDKQIRANFKLPISQA